MTRTGMDRDAPDTSQADPLNDDDGPVEDAAATARKRLGVEDWLLLSESGVDKARQAWKATGQVYLRCGTLFGVVRLPGHVVQAAAGDRRPAQVDAFLAEALGGGPVFASVGLNRYYALVGVDDCHDWTMPGVECLPPGTEIAVPDVKHTEYVKDASYWSVPMAIPGSLCSMDLLVAMIARGLAQLPKVEQELGDRGDAG